MVCKSTHFFTLHEKFEELYNEAAETADAIAERLLVSADSLRRLYTYLEQASITDEVGKTASEMVESLVQDYKQISRESKFVIGIAEEQNDPSTADLFVGLVEEADKHVWMLSAYLGE